jgi:bifunctional non-homologous end joining protein LigD
MLGREDAVDYYRRVARWMLPHLRGVPVSFRRWPDEIGGESFWEKDAPSFTPDWVRTFAVPRRGGESDIHYIVIDDARTLTWLASIGGIEIHPFLHRVPDVERAFAVVFDLDPGEGATLADCCEVALLLREVLDDAYVKVSGSKGMQVTMPADAPHKATEAYARAVAEELARKHPRLITAKMGKTYRARKVFIDYSQNADYKTTVAVYSLRATGLVSMPVTWEEVESRSPLEFTPAAALARLRKLGDLWMPYVGRASARPSARRAEARPTLPSPRSQSGRRLFVLDGDELRLEMGGRFHRWRGETYIGEMKIDPAYYRGGIAVDDTGSYEVIEGSFERGWFRLWFSGKKLRGERTLSAGA